MPIDFIRIDPAASVHAVQLRSFIQVLRQAYEQGVQVLEKMQHTQDGTVFTTMEQTFGVPSGTGQAVYDLVNGTVGAMEGTFQNNNAKNLNSRVG